MKTAWPRSQSFAQGGEVAALFGRLCLAAIFLWSGYGKAISMTATVAFFSKLGVPLPTLAYVIAAVVELVGGALFVVGVFYRPVALILGGYCIATAFLGHANFSDRNMVIHFYKNVAMFGGFLQAFVLGTGTYSLGAFLRSRKDS